MNLYDPGARVSVRDKLIELWKRLAPHALSFCERLAPTAGVLALAAGLAFSGLGPALDDFAFRRPLARLRLLAGFGAELDPRVRVILVDDRSLQKLGRSPRFGDWQRIASRLYDVGVERALLVGIHSLPEQLGELEPKDARGRLFVGGGFVADERNTLSVAPSELPPAFLERLSPELGRAAAAWPEAARVITLASEAWPLIDGVGDLTVGDDNSIAIGTRFGAESYLPSMPLTAVAGGAVAYALPLSADGRLHADLVPGAVVAKASLPVSAFFDPKTGAVGPLDPRVRERLEGARVVVMIPVASTGQRLVDTPLGKLPSYMVTVSAVSGALSRRLLHRVVPDHVVILAGLLLALALPLAGGLKRKTLLAFPTTLAFAVFGAAMLQRSGVIVPVVSATLPLLAAWAFAAWAAGRRARDDRLRLRAEMQLGRRVQDWMLPREREGEVGAWRYRVIFRPHGDLSGDWFQIYSDPEGGDPALRRTVIAIGDVVGKGVSAALITSVIASVWRAYALGWANGAPLELEALSLAIDHAVQNTFRGSQNTTLQIAFLQGDVAKVSRFAAGQWHLLCGSELIKTRTQPNKALGMPGPLKYRDVSLTPKPGDLLIACTDGALDGSVSYLEFGKALSAGTAGRSDARMAFVERCAIEVGRHYVLPDDFTMLLIERREDAVTERAAS